MKRALLILALAPVMALAAGTEAKKADSKSKSTTTAKADKMDLMLTGATDTNRMEIEKLAKDAGATQASLDTKNGKLTVSGKKFDKAKFSGSLSSVSGVSLKN